MAWCERCGSIQLARARGGNALQRALRVIGMRTVICRRCGWRSFRSWQFSEITRQQAPLTTDHIDSSPGTADTGFAELPTSTGDATATKDFDLSQIEGLDRVSFVTETTAQTGQPARRRKPRKAGRAGKRPRRREVAVTAFIGLTALVAVLVAFRGCEPPADYSE